MVRVTVCIITVVIYWILLLLDTVLSALRG